MTRTTKHAKERIPERVGIPKSSAERQFKLALERGYRQNQLKGRLEKWVTSVALSGKYARTCIVYNNHLFVTDKSEVLITVISIPSNLLKNLNSYIKK